jgi:hypothetical protein
MHSWPETNSPEIQSSGILSVRFGLRPSDLLSSPGKMKDSIFDLANSDDVKKAYGKDGPTITFLRKIVDSEKVDDAVQYIEQEEFMVGDFKRMACGLFATHVKTASQYIIEGNKTAFATVKTFSTTHPDLWESIVDMGEDHTRAMRLKRKRAASEITKDAEMKQKAIRKYREMKADMENILPHMTFTPEVTAFMTKLSADLDVLVHVMPHSLPVAQEEAAEE